MNNRYKDLTIKLSDTLQNQTFKFIIDEIGNKEEDVSDILNLILSSHISALGSSMAFVATDHPKIKTFVSEFIVSLLKHVSKSHPIETVEVLKQ